MRKPRPLPVNCGIRRGGGHGGGLGLSPTAKRGLRREEPDPVRGSGLFLVGGITRRSDCVSGAESGHRLRQPQREALRHALPTD